MRVVVRILSLALFVHCPGFWNIDFSSSSEFHIAELVSVAHAAQPRATIQVDASRVTGAVHPFVFGHQMEHEYNTIQDGLWAELLHDRKFEQGDKDLDGVSDGWVPEERITNRYWELVNGKDPNVRYFI